MRRYLIWILFILLVWSAAPAFGQARPLAILHTNDLHSHFRGFAPESEYTPDTVGDDAVVGGFARLARAIDQAREDRSGAALTVDAGDFSMGTLYHLAFRERAYEARLLTQMGYDAATFGNHEFDFGPRGLARMLETARYYNGLPRMVQANARFDAKDPRDDELEKAWKNVGVKPYTIITRAGLRVGLFGLLGRDAAEVTPWARPVRFADAVETSREIVEILRKKERVDLVVALSHGGLEDDISRSEDEILARKVRGIDVIVSGHTHTLLEQPRRVKDTLIVQAGSYGRALGILDLVVEADEKVRFVAWRALPINDRLPGRPDITARVDEFSREIDEEFLASQGYRMDGVLAETKVDLVGADAESNLGNLAADGIRWAADRHRAKAEEPVVAAMISNGVLRDDLIGGLTGRIQTADAFRTVPLGLGPDGRPGYPLVSFYLTAAEIKKALEITPSIYPRKGSNYFVQVSGVKYTYNPHRLIFDRVTDVWLGDENAGYQPLDCSPNNARLYRVAADIYNAGFLKVIGGYTHGFLEIVPKNAQGQPLADLTEALMDADPAVEGIQEVKEWKAVLEYLKSFSDRDGNELPDVPDRYRAPTGRIQSQPTWHPWHLVRNPAWHTRAAALLASAIVAAAFFIWLRFRRRTAKGTPGGNPQKS